MGAAQPNGSRKMVGEPPTAVVSRVEAWWPVINRAATVYHVRQSLIEAVIHQESGGDPDAFRVEPAVVDASFGLMQVLLATARTLGFHGPPRDLFLAGVNIDLGTHYLQELMLRYSDEHFALLHYNGGGTAVALWRSGHRGFRADHYAASVTALQLFYAYRNEVVHHGAP